MIFIKLNHRITTGHAVSSSKSSFNSWRASNNLESFLYLHYLSTQKVCQICACGGLAREKQNMLTPLPCLHTVMQTRLSANQSARTISVIL